MKKIYFIRHSKAKKNGENDFKRILSDKGILEAKILGKKLEKQHIKPDIIFSSDALRAKKTSEILSKKIGYNEEKIAYIHDLYNSNLSFYLDFIKNIDNKYSMVFIIGHNPEITFISELLSNSIVVKMPTSGIFGIEFSVNTFKDIEEHSGKVILFDYLKKEDK